MADDFAAMIPAARTFYGALSNNNTKEWWQANKATYDADLKAPALLLLDVLAVDLGRITGAPVSTKLFRPHRDVRFSKDKSPYNTHLHMLWTLGDGRPGFFLGLSHTYRSVGGGMMGFSKDQLLAYRDAVDQGALPDVVQQLGAQGFELREPELKRVPAPYPKDHPHADLLKRKSCVMWQELPENTDALLSAVRDHFTALWQLGTVLDAL